jgi:hypothetical protein
MPFQNVPAPTEPGIRSEPSKRIVEADCRNSAILRSASFAYQDGITSTGLGASDWTPQIAQLKGQRDAIGKALRHKDCGIAQAPIDSSQEAILRWSRRARTEDSNA